MKNDPRPWTHRGPLWTRDWMYLRFPPRTSAKCSYCDRHMLVDRKGYCYCDGTGCPAGGMAVDWESA